jgi:hypothetical protein
LRPKEIDDMDAIRRRVLKVHSVILILLGASGAVVATAGWALAAGPYTFLHDNRLGHAGLIQAYLLAMLLGVVLWLGSRQPTPATWNMVGAGVHLCILVAYILHWDFLASLGPDLPTIRNVVVCVHVGLVLLEVWAAFGLRERATRVSHSGASARAA